MRIQMRPPRLMWRVIARRAASICRAVSRPRPTAFRPKSPKLTLAPTVATPLFRPFCSLRYLRLAGCSILRSCVGGRLADLLDVEPDVRAHHLAQVRTQRLDVLALLADDDTRARAVNRYARVLRRTLDRDLANRCVRELLAKVLADLDVLVQRRREVL